MTALRLEHPVQHQDQQSSYNADNAYQNISHITARFARRRQDSADNHQPD